MTPLSGEKNYLHKAQVEEIVCVYFSFVWFVSVTIYFPPALHSIYFMRLRHDNYRLIALLFITNKPSQIAPLQLHRTRIAAYMLELCFRNNKIMLF